MPGKAASRDQPAENRARTGDDVAVSPDNQRPAELVKHRPALADATAEPVFNRVQVVVDVASVRVYCFPAVALLKDRLVVSIGLCGVTRDEEGLRDLSALRPGSLPSRARTTAPPPSLNQAVILSPFTRTPAAEGFLCRGHVADARFWARTRTKIGLKKRKATGQGRAPHVRYVGGTTIPRSFPVTVCVWHPGSIGSRARASPRPA